MAREKKEIVEEEDAGAPEWMVTFSDCMTLLLTFFVLLLSFSSFSDVSNYRKMTVSFSEMFSSVSNNTSDRRAMLSVSLKDPLEKEVEKGGVTRSPKDSADKEGGMNQTHQPDYHQQKIFVVPSEKVYYGRGVILSAQGRAILDDMVSFLNEFHNRVVISECLVGDAAGEDKMGLQRAWSVVDYLKRAGIKIDRLSISSLSTIMQEGDAAEGKRMLQIVLLEKESYN